MAINRCICSNIYFSEIKKIAEEKDLETVGDLQKEGICSQNCQLCVPYIEKMFETGKTEFVYGRINHKGH